VTQLGTPIIERIAASASCASEVVEQTLSDYGLSLAATRRRHRSIRLDRLRVRGNKSGETEAGEFDATFNFAPGVTVIAADNLRGKTSILELITFVLRGEPRNLQADVLSWLEHISLDAHINGQPIGFRLVLNASVITCGKILAGGSTELAASDDAIAADVAELARASDGEEWADQVGTFMMSQLGLDEIQVYNRPRNDDEAGTIKSHGWPAYFNVLYPPAGADTVLLGGTAADQLPIRLMQVFLDMPEATRWMRVYALEKRLVSEFEAEQRRGKDANATIAKQLTDAESRQAAAESRLTLIRGQQPAESLQELARLSAEAGERLASARQEADVAASGFAQARSDRIADEKALNLLRESRAASALFHGLDPQSCPRCEVAISEQRRAREHDDQHCAVCDSALIVVDQDEYEERDAQAVGALEATRAAESALEAALGKSQMALSLAQSELDAVAARLTQAQAAHQVAERIEAEQELAGARAVVETLRAMAPEMPQLPLTVVVLGAAAKYLKEEITQVSAALYSELSDATRDLAKSFGIGELEAIRIKANGNMDVTKGGGAKSSFSSQSPGERLRLRYALVVALLRIAQERDIAGHPGLLLLDSLKAEEVQDDHARTLLQGLVTAAVEQPGMQILVTTADQALAGSVSGVAATITPKLSRTTLF